MFNALNVFDEEAEIADQSEAESWFVLAEAGCDLEQARAFQKFTGVVN